MNDMRTKNIKISFSLEESEGYKRQVVRGEIPKELKKNLTIKHFVEDELSLIISKSHPFAKKKKINKKNILYINLIK